MEENGEIRQRRSRNFEERERQRQRDTERDKQTSTTIVKVHKKEYDRKQINVRSYKMIVAN